MILLAEEEGLSAADRKIRELVLDWADNQRPLLPGASWQRKRMVIINKNTIPKKHSHN